MNKIVQINKNIHITKVVQLSEVVQIFQIVQINKIAQINNIVQTNKIVRLNKIVQMNNFVQINKIVQIYSNSMQVILFEISNNVFVFLGVCIKNWNYLSFQKKYRVQNKTYCGVCNTSVIANNYPNHLKAQGHNDIVLKHHCTNSTTAKTHFIKEQLKIELVNNIANIAIHQLQYYKNLYLTH